MNLTILNSFSFKFYDVQRHSVHFIVFYKPQMLFKIFCHFYEKVLIIAFFNKKIFLSEETCTCIFLKIFCYAFMLHLIMLLRLQPEIHWNYFIWRLLTITPGTHLCSSHNFPLKRKSIAILAQFLSNNKPNWRFTLYCKSSRN